ncbi:MAG: hypothetical protein KAU14_07525, partial [Thermoplasmata archaeon]|nr:hypothetical protein [Thermoplasmata archaeon]
SNATDDGSIERYFWESSINGVFYNETFSFFYNATLSLGKHIITHKVTDNHNFWSEPVTFVLNITNRPVAIIENIFPDPALDSDSVHFQGSGTDDGDIIRYVWNSSINGELYNGTSNESLNDSLSPGLHNISLRVQDNLGFWSELNNTTLIVHTQPVAIIESISPDQTLEGEEVHFMGNGTDDGTITLYLWCSSLDKKLYNGTNSSFSISNLSLGNHTIYLKVQDNHGIWSEEVNMSLVINLQTTEDTEPPSVTITSPEDGATVNGTITISGTAYDNVGIVKVEYRFYGTEEWLQAMGTNSWSIELDTTQLKDGEYTLEFRAYDGKQYSEIQSLTINVENEKKDSESSDDNFLLEKIGPLPLAGYLVIVVGVVLIGLVVAKKGR